MKNQIRRSFGIAAATFALLALGTPSVQAQDFDEVGGPYEPDENTVVLMHFNGNLDNAADTDNGGSTKISDPVGYGNLEEVTSSDFKSLMDLDDREDMMQQIHLDNESLDSTFITIADTTALDLKGSWTMEAWVFVRGFGAPQLSGSRLFFKPGTPPNAAYQSNYFFNIQGANELYRTGYWENTGSPSHQEIASPNGSVQANHWLHLTFIRDTTKNVILQLVHEGVNTDDPDDPEGDLRPDEVQLKYFASQSFDPISEAPPVPNESPLFIGGSPQGGPPYDPDDPSTYYGADNKYLWAYMDELRISNTVRNFATPPVVSNVELPHRADPGGTLPLYEQDYAPKPNESYEVKADIGAVTGTSDFQYARLKYRTGGSGGFTSVPLDKVNEDEDTYSATLPGQPMNTKVEYFIEAKTDDGNPKGVGNYTRRPQADSLYYNYAIVPDSSQTLNLTFETDDGGDVVNDAEGFTDAFDVQTYGGPDFVDEGAPIDGGDRSIKLDGVDDHLAVLPPGASYMNGKNFTLDFWFKADSIEANERWIIKEGLTNPFDFNYQIWQTTGPDQITPAAYVTNNRTGEVQFDSSYADGNWWNVQYMLEDDTTYARVINAAGDTVESVGGPLSAEPEQSATFLGRGPFRVGAYSGSLPGGLYAGQMDEIKFYNYVPASYKTDDTGTAIDERPGEVTRLALQPNRPNPFRTKTAIEYGLNKTGQATLVVYDVLGRKVKTLVDGIVPAGTHKATFQAGNLSSGVYFYRLSTDGAVKTKKMIVLK